MKKNKFLRVAAALLVVAVLTTCGMTGAMAKYYKTFTSTSATVRAGLFWVTGPGTTDAIVETTLYEGDGGAPEAAADAAKYGDSAKDIIVPGTVLKAKAITVKNYSEVGVEISIDSITCTEGGMPLLFSDDAGLTWDTNIANLADLIPTGTTTTLPPQNGTVTFTPNLWILWPFDQTPSAIDGEISENDDDDDTAIGVAQAGDLLDLKGTGTLAAPIDPTYGFTTASTTHELSFTLTITATQVD